MRCLCEQWEVVIYEVNHLVKQVSTAHVAGAQWKATITACKQSRGAQRGKFSMSRNRKSHRNFLFLRFFPLFSFALTLYAFSYCVFLLLRCLKAKNPTLQRRRRGKIENSLRSPHFPKWFSLYTFRNKKVMSAISESSATAISGKKHILYPSTSQQSSSTASPPSKFTMASGSGQAKSSASCAPKHQLSGSQSYIQQQQQTLINQPQPNPHQYYSLRWNNYQSWVCCHSESPKDQHINILSQILF